VTQLVLSTEKGNFSQRQINFVTTSSFKEIWVTITSMKKSFCELVLNYFPRISQLGNLYATNITNCVFNSFLSYTTIMLNIVTIHAIRKTSSLPKTVKTLLLSLAVSDVAVGFLVQPFYTSILIKWLQKMIPNCGTYRTFAIIGNLFATASFLGVVAVSVDRFLAIHLHLR